MANAKISCQCGTVHFQASLPAPLETYICHCLECRKQSGSAFGTSAIFPADGMWPLPGHVKPNIGVWTRPADSGNTIECYFCRVCGVRVLHRCVSKDGTPKQTLTVKGGCVEGFTLEGAKHIFVRSALVPVPEGSYMTEPE